MIVKAGGGDSLACLVCYCKERNMSKMFTMGIGLDIFLYNLCNACNCIAWVMKCHGRLYLPIDNHYALKQIRVLNEWRK